jgi:hypothetical protein
VCCGYLILSLFLSSSSLLCRPQVEFPVLLDSSGAKFIDIRKLQPT